MIHFDFVKACISGRTEQEVAKALGMDTHTVANVASRMRRRGVELPPFKRKLNHEQKPIFTDKLDVAACNKLILER